MPPGVHALFNKRQRRRRRRGCGVSDQRGAAAGPEPALRQPRLLHSLPLELETSPSSFPKLATLRSQEAPSISRPRCPQSTAAVEGSEQSSGPQDECMSSPMHLLRIALMDWPLFARANCPCPLVSLCLTAPPPPVYSQEMN